MVLVGLLKCPTTQTKIQDLRFFTTTKKNMRKILIAAYVVAKLITVYLAFFG